MTQENYEGFLTFLMLMAMLFWPVLFLIMPPIWMLWPPNWNRYRVKTGRCDTDKWPNEWSTYGYQIRFLPGAREVMPFIPYEIRISKGWFEWRIKFITHEQPAGSLHKCEYDVWADRLPWDPWPRPVTLMRWGCKQVADFGGKAYGLISEDFYNNTISERTIMDFVES